MKYKNYLLLIALCCAWLCLPITTNGQVKIGEGTQPEKGAVLDLKKTTSEGYLGGMLLPQVNITDLGYIPAAFTDADKMPGYNAANGVDTNTDLAGLVVYNTNIVTAGVYMWDGDNWIQVVNTFNLNKVIVGTATLSGTTCYDVKMTDYFPSVECGVMASRTNGFESGYSKIYKFKSTSAVTELQFVAVNNNTLIPVVAGLTNDSPGSVGANVEYEVTLNFDTDIRTKATGLTSANPTTVTLYAVYKVGGVSYQKSLTVRVQDCVCCGANLDAGWKTFMCHNLGADMTAEPFTPAAAIHGAKYKFGNFVPAVDQATDQDHSYDGGWANSTWSSMTTRQTAGAWNPANDPCKNAAYGGGPGWRLPTRDEWAQVINAANGNIITRTATATWATATNGNYNFDAGVFLGPTLFLPAAGGRQSSTGMLAARGHFGYYWSSTSSGIYSSDYLQITGSSGTGGVTYTVGSVAFSVRCVAE